jgi:hypothetical protein
MLCQLSSKYRWLRDITVTLIVSTLTWLKHWVLAMEMLILRWYCLQRLPRRRPPRDKSYRLSDVLSSGLSRYWASESTPWTGRTSATFALARGGASAWRLLTSLSLVRVYWQEDTDFPKQQFINACRDTVGHRKYMHYSLGTGNIAHSSVDSWWRGQMKMGISSYVCFGLTSRILLKWE